jgi:hypothetical protein
MGRLWRLARSPEAPKISHASLLAWGSLTGDANHAPGWAAAGCSKGGHGVGFWCWLVCSGGCDGGWGAEVPEAKNEKGSLVGGAGVVDTALLCFC